MNSVHIAMDQFASLCFLPLVKYKTTAGLIDLGVKSDHFHAHCSQK